jgi:hypothetical protein
MRTTDLALLAQKLSDGSEKMRGNPIKAQVAIFFLLDIFNDKYGNNKSHFKLRVVYDSKLIYSLKYL